MRDIEISLVLDISCSMNSGRRIQYLKSAAKSFANSVLADRTEESKGDISISLVPYQTEVAVGAAMLGQIELTARHDYSACVDFTAGDFETVVIDYSSPRQQTAHFDPAGDRRRGEAVGSHAPMPEALPCRNTKNVEVVYLSEDEGALHRRIDQLSANGNTSIDVGLKWSAALLDPSSRLAVGEFARRGLIDSKFIGRHFDYGRANQMKVLVVMTDGENVDQRKLRATHAGSNPSDVWMY